MDGVRAARSVKGTFREKGSRFMRLYREDKSGEATAEPAGDFVLPLVSSQMGGDSRTQQS